jgi:hypothetical protein
MWISDMNRSAFSTLRRFIAIVLVGIFLISPEMVKSEVRSTSTSTADTACRFGITSALGANGYDIQSLGVGSYLDWGAVTNPTLPEGVEYIRVLRLRSDVYSSTLANLAAWVAANPGGVWVVGNEPDTTYDFQDGIEAEVYADRYYELAKIIRRLDPAAKIGFGTIVQPTPIRIRYLQLAWNHLVADAGSTASASSLIDIWTIHSFILNEQCGYWGTGIPPGFSCYDPDREVITDLTDTYSIDIFQERIIAFRAWMSSIGERNKPLWITEYGSLLPPVDPIGGPDYVNVSDADTSAFMLDTFNFMLSAADEQTGLPEDGNQLVQRWSWYSLNDHRYRFGGSLYNPDYPDYPEYGDFFLTPVGQAFIDYQDTHLQEPDLYPMSLSISPLSYNEDRTLVNYRLDILVDNNQFEDATCGQLWIYNGDPNDGGSLIAGPLPASVFKANYGLARISVHWLNVPPLENYEIYVHVEPIGISDSDPSNNWASFSVYADLPKLNFMPLVQH